MKVNAVRHTLQKPRGIVPQEVCTNPVEEIVAAAHTADLLLSAGPAYLAAQDGMCLKKLQMVMLAERTHF